MCEQARKMWVTRLAPGRCTHQHGDLERTSFASVCVRLCPICVSGGKPDHLTPTSPLQQRPNQACLAGEELIRLAETTQPVLLLANAAARGLEAIAPAAATGVQHLHPYSRAMPIAGTIPRAMKATPSITGRATKAKPLITGARLFTTCWKAASTNCTSILPIAPRTISRGWKTSPPMGIGTISVLFIVSGKPDRSDKWTASTPTWATRNPGGFNEHARAALRDLVPVLVWRKSATAARITRTVGRVYLGRDAAEQVMRGRISRRLGMDQRGVVVFGFARLDRDQRSNPARRDYSISTTTMPKLPSTPFTMPAAMCSS